MPDASNPVPPPPKIPSPAAPPDAGHMPMEEEFDSAKWRLPPALPIVLALAGVAIIVGLIAFIMRAKPVASGTITGVATLDEQSNTLVAVRVTMNNKIEKQLWISDISSELKTADGKTYPDHAAAAVDVERYLQAFPPDKIASVKGDPLREETKIPPGKSYTGVAVFSYPVGQAAFDARKSLTVRISMYDQPTLVLRSPPSP